MPQYTKFRIQVSDDRAKRVVVTLTGTNLGCEEHLYVSPLTTIETQKWIGRWTTCPVIENSREDNRERCTFDCPCNERCAEIQVMKMPMSIQGSSWTVCDVSMGLVFNSEGTFTLSILSLFMFIVFQRWNKIHRINQSSIFLILSYNYYYYYYYY